LKDALLLTGRFLLTEPTSTEGSVMDSILQDYLVIKTMGALKGSSTLSAIGTIANNYDGMRVGFEMTK
jgi:hypothetical protein